MNSKKKALSLTIATAAAIAFVTAPITSTVTFAAKKVPCYGINSCKGKSQCKMADNSCKGKNDCKGKGVAMVTAAKCKKMNGSTDMPQSSSTTSSSTTTTTTTTTPQS